MVEQLRRRYGEDEIRRDLAFAIEELKNQLLRQRVALARQVFDELIRSEELRFILLSGCLQSAVPDKIAASPSAPLIDSRGNPPQYSLFDYRDEDFNHVERDVVLYLDQQNWVFAWARNFSKIGYRVQGWKTPIYPDFVVFAKRDETPSEFQEGFQEVYVLETKGLHLKGNEDTVYKQELFALCNDLCQPRP